MSQRQLLAGIVAVLIGNLPSAGSPRAAPRETHQTDGSQTIRAHFVASEGQCLRVATAGVRTRDANPSPPTATGAIVLPEGPNPDNILWAALYWSNFGPSPPANNVTLNDQPVSPSPLSVRQGNAALCFSASTSSFPFFAEVTGLVVEGTNVVAGIDESGFSQFGLIGSNGASLVVVYNGETFGACEIIILDGNDLLNECDEQVDNAFPVTCGSGIAASLTFIGAHGSGPPTYPNTHSNQLWNLVRLGDADDFDASDPGAPGAAPDLGWDTDTWNVETSGQNVATVYTECSALGDCVSWIATVLQVGGSSCLVSVEEESWGRLKARYRLPGNE